jgi:hypothetical protein
MLLDTPVWAVFRVLFYVEEHPWWLAVASIVLGVVVGARLRGGS